MKVYCASRSKLPLSSLLICVKKMGIDLVPQTAGHVFDVARQSAAKPFKMGALFLHAAAASLLLLFTSAHKLIG